MQIDELKENNVKDEIGNSTAEVAMQQRFIIKFNNVLRFLDKYTKQNKVTLEELREEIIQKTSQLSRFQRDFLSAWKLDFIQDCINIIREYDRINRERNFVDKSVKCSTKNSGERTDK